MEFTQFVLLAAVIAGVTELIKRLRAKDYWTAITIATAAVVGGVFGLLGLDTVPNVETGIAAGFALSGTMSILGSFGNKSEAAPSESTFIVK